MIPLHRIQVTAVPTALALASLLAASLIGCAELPAASEGTTRSQISASEGACFVDRHQQPVGLRAQSVDLLFVTDTSGSLDREREAVAAGIDSFVAQLPAEVDFRIGVLLGHGSTSARSGRLYSAGGEEVLRSGALELPAIREQLRRRLTGVETDSGSDGGEEGLYSLLRAISPPLLAESRAKGFFRPEAALAVVFVSDENDVCAEYPAGIVPVPDPDGLEPIARARDCSGVSPASALSALRALQGERPFSVSAIAYTDRGSVPADGENEVGYGLIDLAMLAGGVAIDMASGDFAQGLARIGRRVTSELQLKTRFPLSRADADPETLEVRVDDRKLASFEYSAEANEVRLPQAEAGRELSRIEISYCPKVGPGPSPSPGPSGSPLPGPGPGLGT
jgi:hypothetical protein